MASSSTHLRWNSNGIVLYHRPFDTSSLSDPTDFRSIPLPLRLFTKSTPGRYDTRESGILVEAYLDTVVLWSRISRSSGYRISTDGASFNHFTFGLNGIRMILMHLRLWMSLRPRSSDWSFAIQLDACSSIDIG